MKTMMRMSIIIGLIFGFVSMAMAENWYAADERSSNDYRSSAGAMIAEVDGSRYTPQYTAAEMKSTRVAADTRQMAQSSAVAARASGQSPIVNRTVTVTTNSTVAPTGSQAP